MNNLERVGAITPKQERLPNIVKLTILGEIKGKQRPKATRIGNTARVYTPKETTYYENKVANEYRRKYGTTMAFERNTPMKVVINVYHKLQSIHYGKKGINKSGLDKLNGKAPVMLKPDCDNIAKICLDALNEIAFNDDKEIDELIIKKHYAEQPRVDIEISEIMYGE